MFINIKVSQNIKTITNSCETKLKEKNSIFIGQALPVSSSEEIEQKLNEIRKNFYDATHHCYAYRLITGQFKYSDDGEPGGTAGIKILSAIDHFDLTNLLVVVTRYFGGTKLGTGLLGKTYYNSAYQTLDLSEKLIKENYTKVIISSDFSFLNQIHHLISKYDAILKNSSFDNISHFEILVKTNALEQFSINIKELSNGRININISEDGIYI